MKTQNTTHTPGPWSLETKGSKHFIDGEDGLTIAYIDRKGVREGKEIEANVKLIAASPRLLAALRGLVALAGEEPDLGELEMEPEERAALDFAREVLKEAEGK